MEKPVFESLENRELLSAPSIAGLETVIASAVPAAVIEVPLRWDWGAAQYQSIIDSAGPGDTLKLVKAEGMYGTTALNADINIGNPFIDPHHPGSGPVTVDLNGYTMRGKQTLNEYANIVFTNGLMVGNNVDDSIVNITENASARFSDVTFSMSTLNGKSIETSSRGNHLLIDRCNFNEPQGRNITSIEATTLGHKEVSVTRSFIGYGGKALVIGAEDYTGTASKLNILNNTIVYLDNSAIEFTGSLNHTTGLISNNSFSDLKTATKNASRNARNIVVTKNNLYEVIDPFLDIASAGAGTLESMALSDDLFLDNYFFDPLYVNGVPYGDFHLQGGSPLKDRGYFGPETDYLRDGNHRYIGAYAPEGYESGGGGGDSDGIPEPFTLISLGLSGAALGLYSSRRARDKSDESCK